jgi:hypothetical protein
VGNPREASLSFTSLREAVAVADDDGTNPQARTSLSLI